MNLQLEIALELGWKLWTDVSKPCLLAFIEPPQWRPSHRYVDSYTHNITEVGAHVQRLYGDAMQRLYGDAMDDVPDWPNDYASAARDVLPEITRRGWYYTITSQIGGEVACRIDLDVKGSDDAVIAPTFAMAVCLAFVRACKKAKS